MQCVIEVQSFIAKDDTTGEDPEVRRVAVNALGNHAGTVVVMDPMSGRVYTVVNQEWAFVAGLNLARLSSCHWRRRPFGKCHSAS